VQFSSDKRSEFIAKYKKNRRGDAGSENKIFRLSANDEVRMTKFGISRPLFVLRTLSFPLSFVVCRLYFVLSFISDTSGWPQGMYLARLVFMNEVVAGEKITILRR